MDDCYVEQYWFREVVENNDKWNCTGWYYTKSVKICIIGIANIGSKNVPTLVVTLPESAQI